MRDWIWDAVDELPPKLRLVLMLRHFSGVTSYQEIADVCEVPVGTVRSRLNQAKGKMAQVLLSTATQAHDDAAAPTEDSRHEAVETLQASERGQLPQEISELWPADSELVGPLSRPGERTHPVPVMRQTLDFGVRQSLRHVVAGRDITIWENGRHAQRHQPRGRPHLPADPRLAHVPPEQKGAKTAADLSRAGFDGPGRVSGTPMRRRCPGRDGSPPLPWPEG